MDSRIVLICFSGSTVKKYLVTKRVEGKAFLFGRPVFESAEECRKQLHFIVAATFQKAHVQETRQAHVQETRPFITFTHYSTQEPERCVVFTARIIDLPESCGEWEWLTKDQLSAAHDTFCGADQQIIHNIIFRGCP